MNNGGQTASLSSVPNALSRWTEETRVLEADSMHDAVTGKLAGLWRVMMMLSGVWQCPCTTPEDSGSKQSLNQCMFSP